MFELSWSRGSFLSFFLEGWVDRKKDWEKISENATLKGSHWFWAEHWTDTRKIQNRSPRWNIYGEQINWNSSSTAAKHLEINLLRCWGIEQIGSFCQSEMKLKHTKCWWDHDQLLLFCSNKSDSGRGSLIKFKFSLFYMLFFCSTVSPRLIVKPHAVYLRSFEGESEVNMNVTIKGGVPKPMVRKLIAMQCRI